MKMPVPKIVDKFTRRDWVHHWYSLKVKPEGDELNITFVKWEDSAYPVASQAKWSTWLEHDNQGKFYRKTLHTRLIASVEDLLLTTYMSPLSARWINNKLTYPNAPDVEPKHAIYLVQYQCKLNRAQQTLPQIGLQISEMVLRDDVDAYTQVRHTSAKVMAW